VFVSPALPFVLCILFFHKRHQYRYIGFASLLRIHINISCITPLTSPSPCAFSWSKSTASAVASTTNIQSTHVVLTGRGITTPQSRPSSWGSHARATHLGGEGTRTSRHLAIVDTVALTTRATLAVTLHLAIVIDERNCQQQGSFHHGGYSHANRVPLW
jgi:hypothetical protein